MIDRNKLDKLFKRIMKKDLTAINEIETLEEAKEMIAKMATFNIAFHVLERIKEDFY